jgi:hypothetical protein
MTTSKESSASVDIALPHAAILEAGTLQPVAREQQHVERKIEAKPALDLPAEQFEHTARTGAEIEQRAERLVGKRGTDRLLDRIVGHMQFADAIPFGGVRAKISLRGGGAGLPHGGEPRAVARDGLIGGIEALDQRACNFGPSAMLGQTKKGPRALAEAFDKTGFGEKLEMARNARLRLAQDVGEIGNGELRFGK